MFRRRTRQPLFGVSVALLSAAIFGSRALAQNGERVAEGSSVAQVTAGRSIAAGGDRTAGWFVVGGTGRVTLLQALGDGRALLCDDGRCVVWDRVGGISTPTDGISVSVDALAHFRRSNGDVVAVDGSRKSTPKIWNHVVGHWTTGAPLPEPLRDIRIAELVDGRIAAAGETSGVRRARAYVADAQLRAWSLLIDGPDDVTHPSLVPTESGAILWAGERIWRYVVGTEGWRRLTTTIPTSARSVSLAPWGDELLLTYQEAGRWTASIVGRDDQIRQTAALPEARTGFGLTSIGTAGPTNMWLLSADKDKYVWRHPDEPPIVLPSDLVALSPKIVAIDDKHLLGIALSGTLVEVALDGIGPPGRTCNGLLGYLSGTSGLRSSGSELELVRPGCRDEAKRGEAPALLALVRSWAVGGERANIGRAFECSLQDARVVDELPRWFRGGLDEHARSVCYRSLATWPGAEGVWTSALENAVNEQSDRWHVDPAVIEFASTNPTPEARDRLFPLVRSAGLHHAVGFDALRSAVCVADPFASDGRRQTCREFASQHETEWHQREATLEEHRQRSASVKKHLPWMIGATAVSGGAVGAAYATRDTDVGRGIAVASGALAGAAMGFTVATLSALRGNWVSKSGRELEPVTVGAIVLGAVVGGVGAYLLTPSPGARAPVTGAALAFPCALIWTIGFD
jgi:hypothetical protein